MTVCGMITTIEVNIPLDNRRVVASLREVMIGMLNIIFGH